MEYGILEVLVGSIGIIVSMVYWRLNSIEKILNERGDGDV